jgi:hypothetical protein
MQYLSSFAATPELVPYLVDAGENRRIGYVYSSTPTLQWHAMTDA